MMVTMREERPHPELASAAEGATILNVSRQRFDQLAARANFPTPIARLACGRIWLADDLRAHHETRPKRRPRQDGGPVTQP